MRSVADLRKWLPLVAICAGTFIVIVALPIVHEPGCSARLWRKPASGAKDTFARISCSSGSVRTP
jgi:hypothetical protein